MGKTETSGEIVIPRQAAYPEHITNPAALPSHMAGKFELRAWFDSLANKTPYEELDPDYMAQRMLMLTLMSPTPDAVMTPKTLTGLQDLIPNSPGQGTGPITISDIYVAKSDQTDGNPCFMLITYFEEMSGIQVTTTTGATHLQAQFCTLLAMGVWPLRGQIKRGDRPDRGGRYLFSFQPVD